MVRPKQQTRVVALRLHSGCREGGGRTDPQARECQSRCHPDDATEASTVRGRRGKLSLDKGWPGEQVQSEGEKQQNPRLQRLLQKALFIHQRASSPEETALRDGHSRWGQGHSGADLPGQGSCPLVP